MNVAPGGAQSPSTRLAQGMIQGRTRAPAGNFFPKFLEQPAGGQGQQWAPPQWDPQYDQAPPWADHDPTRIVKDTRSGEASNLDALRQRFIQQMMGRR